MSHSLFNLTSEVTEQRHDAIVKLGCAIQQDFQALVNHYIEGWLDQPNWVAEDSRECATLEALLLDVQKIQEDLQTLEQWLTSGFIPGHYGNPSSVPGTTSTSAIALANHVSSVWSSPVELAPDSSETRPSERSTQFPAVKRSEAAQDIVQPEKTLNSLRSSLPAVQGLKDLAQRLEQDSLQGIELIDNVQPPFSPADKGRDMAQLPSLNHPISLKSSNLVPRQYGTQSLDTSRSTSSKPPVATAADLMAVGDGLMRSSSPNVATNWQADEIDSPTGAGQGRSLDDVEPLSTAIGLNAQTGHPHDANDQPQKNLRLSGASIPSKRLDSDSNEEFQETILPRSHLISQSSLSELSESMMTDRFNVPATTQDIPATHLTDIDLAQVMDAIALELQREYRRFYGS